MQILIAEKNRTFRADMVELITLCHPTWQVDATSDVMELMVRLRDTPHDMLFLDLTLPGLGSNVSLAALRAEYPATKIIALGDTNDSASVIGCLQSGLDGYIARCTSLSQLCATLRVIATPDMFVSIGATKLVPAQSEIVHLMRAPETHAAPLTARQTDVLSLLAEGRSTKDIARQLGLAVPTIKTHLAALYRQLGARNRLEAVVKARTAPSDRRAPAMLGAMMQTGDLFDYRVAVN